MPQLKRRKNPHERILAKLFSVPWIIEEDWLANIIEIARYEGDFEALQAKLSHPLTETKTAFVRNGVSHIPISGPIFPKSNLMTNLSGATSLSTFAKDFQVALEDDSVNKIILDIDSPGGAVTGINEMANIIYAAREKKDIVSYISGTGASAAYWLAAAAHEMVLDATARVGSIGVVVAYPGKTDDSRIEIVNTASPNKRIDPNTKKGKKVVTDELNALADVFISTVAVNRGVTEETVRTKFGRGGVLVGQNAVDVGMADRLGSFEQLMSEDINYGGNAMPKSVTQNDSAVFAETLKKESPEAYQDIFEAGAAAAVSESDTILKDKDALIIDLQSELSSAMESNESMSERMDAVEAQEKVRAKNDLIRTEKEHAATAAVIVSTKLSACSIPERLHEKVGAMVSHNSHIVDGVFDVESFSASVDAEITDWESKLENPTAVQGMSIADTGDTDASAEVDSVVERMLANAGIK